MHSIVIIVFIVIITMLIVTFIIFYHTSMLTLHNSLISLALWVPQAWYAEFRVYQRTLLFLQQHLLLFPNHWPKMNKDPLSENKMSLFGEHEGNWAKDLWCLHKLIHKEGKISLTYSLTILLHIDVYFQMSHFENWHQKSQVSLQY